MCAGAANGEGLSLPRNVSQRSESRQNSSSREGVELNFIFTVGVVETGGGMRSGKYAMARWMVALHFCSGGWLASACIPAEGGPLAAWLLRGCLPTALGGLFAETTSAAPRESAYSHTHTKWCGCTAVQEKKDARADTKRHAPTSRLGNAEAPCQMPASREENLPREEVEVHKESACAWCRSEPIFGTSDVAPSTAPWRRSRFWSHFSPLPIPHTPRFTCAVGMSRS
jgi:hypothetical protein